jgi:hypothetical protein
LGDGGVVEVEVLDKGQYVGSVVNSPGILIAFFSGIAKKGGVPHGGHLLPVPFTWILGEVNNEASFKDLVEKGFLTRGQGVFGHPKGCSVPLLGEDSDWEVAL